MYLQNSRNWDRWEEPDECAVTIGTAPSRTRIGMAQSEGWEPGIVIWVEGGEEGWHGPVFLPAFCFYLVVGQLIDATTCKPEWLYEQLSGRG